MKMHHTVDQGVLIDRWDQMLCIIKIKFLAIVKTLEILVLKCINKISDWIRICKFVLNLSYFGSFSYFWGSCFDRPKTKLWGVYGQKLFLRKFGMYFHHTINEAS